MAEMNGWDVAILVVAAYVAVLALVRMMRRRRDAVIAQLQTQVSAELVRKRNEQRREASRSGRAKQQTAAQRNAQRSAKR